MKLRIFVAILMCMFCWTTAQAAPPPVYVEEELVEQLMPDYTLIRGVVEEEKLYLLMQNAAGENMFVGGTQNAEGAWNCYESAPLPEGTILGVENYTTALGIPTENGLITTTVSPFHDGEWGVTEVSFRGGEPIRMGRTWISMSLPLDGLVGEHPWSNIASIDWETLPTTYNEAISKMDFSEWVQIDAPNGFDIYLLAEPKNKGAELIRYLTGTPARMLEQQGKWTRVSVDSVEGWIKTEYLTAGNTERDLINQAHYGTLVHDTTTYYADPYGEVAIGTIEGKKNVYLLETSIDLWVHVWFADTDEYTFIWLEDFMIGAG